MKITFLSPSPNRSGGIRVIAIYARLLADRGHVVEVVCARPWRHSWKQAAKDFVRGRGIQRRRLPAKSYYDDYSVNYRVVSHDGPLVERDVPDSDVVIATWWETAEWLAEMPAAKGEKVYLVQGHEVFAHLPIERCRKTYKAPLKKICVSQWLKQVMATEYGERACQVVSNGVDVKQFHAAKRSKNQAFTVGFLHSKMAEKGADIALEAVALARANLPELRLVAFGFREPDAEVRHLMNEFYRAPAAGEIAKIYSSCDVWLFPSRCEGFGLPILEAMACRTPVIATSAGAAPELLAAGGGRLVEVEDVEGMAKAMIEFANMPAESWSQISDSAYRMATSNTWDIATDAFEDAIVAALDGSWESYCDNAGMQQMGKVEATHS